MYNDPVRVSWNPTINQKVTFPSAFSQFIVVLSSYLKLFLVYFVFTSHLALLWIWLPVVTNFSSFFIFGPTLICSTSVEFVSHMFNYPGAIPAPVFLSVTCQIVLLPNAVKPCSHPPSLLSLVIAHVYFLYSLWSFLWIVTQFWIN